MVLCHLGKTYLTNMVDYWILETGLSVFKTMVKNIIHKAAKATGELKRNKIAEEIVKPKAVTDEN